MSRYTFSMGCRAVESAFRSALVELPKLRTRSGVVSVSYGYDNPMMGYFLDVEDDEEMHAFAYARIPIGEYVGRDDFAALLTDLGRLAEHSGHKDTAAKLYDSANRVYMDIPIK